MTEGTVPTPNDPAPWMSAKGGAAQRYAFEAEAQRARGKDSSPPLTPAEKALLHKWESEVAERVGLKEVTFDRVTTCHEENVLSVAVTAEDTKQRVRANFLILALDPPKVKLVSVSRMRGGQAPVTPSGAGAGTHVHSISVGEGGTHAHSISGGGGAAGGTTHSLTGGGGSVGGSATGSRDEPDEREELPVEQGDEPFIGWKRATLHLGERSIHLTGPYQAQKPVAVEDIASHPRADHLSPDSTGKCKCGFNAMRTYDLMLAEQGANTGNCTLQVELYGRVLVGERGYRAERQRIYAVYLDGEGECQGWLCDRRATHLRRESGESGELTPLCSWHAEHDDALRTVPLSHFASLLGTEVLWMTDISSYDPDLDGDPNGEALWT